MRQSVRKAYFSYFGRAFSIEKRRLLRTGYLSKKHPVSTNAATEVTRKRHQILDLHKN